MSLNRNTCQTRLGINPLMIMTLKLAGSQPESLGTSAAFTGLPPLDDDGVGAGEMAQHSRTLAILREDLSLIPGTHRRQLTAFYNSSERRSDDLFSSKVPVHMLHTLTYLGAHTK